MLLLRNTVLVLLNWMLSSWPLWLPHASELTGKVGDYCIGWGDSLILTIKWRLNCCYTIGGKEEHVRNADLWSAI